MRPAPALAMALALCAAISSPAPWWPTARAADFVPRRVHRPQPAPAPALRGLRDLVPGWTFDRDPRADAFKGTADGFFESPIGPTVMVDPGPYGREVQRLVLGWPEAFGLDPGHDGLTLTRAFASPMGTVVDGAQTHDGYRVRSSYVRARFGPDGRLGTLEGTFVRHLEVAMPDPLDRDGARAAAERAHPATAIESADVLGPFFDRIAGRDVACWTVRLTGPRIRQDVTVDARTLAILSDWPRWTDQDPR